MTSPGGIIPFPAMNVGSTGVINDPGDGAHMANALANFLSYQQQQHENQYRQQQLQAQIQQNQALAQYYQGTVSNDSRRVADEEGKTRAKIKSDREIGLAIQGGQPVSSAGQPGQAGAALQPPPPPPPMQPGNATQTGPGVVAQQGMAAPSAPQPQLGNATQAGGGLVSQVASQVPGMAQPQPPDTPGMINPDTSSPFHQIVNGASQTLAPNGDLSGYQAMFQPGVVSPENVPGLIDEATKMRALQKPLEATPDVLQILPKLEQYKAYDAQNGTHFADDLMSLMRSKGGSTTVSVGLGDKANLAGAEQYQKNSADDVQKGMADARTNFQSFGYLKEAARLVTDDKTFAGFMAKPNLIAARIADSWGVATKDQHDKLIGTQTMITLAGHQVLDFLSSHALGSGNAISNKDLDFVTKIAGQDIGLNKETLMKTFRINYGSTLLKIRDTVDQLREFAKNNPLVGKAASGQADRLERQMAPEVQEYARMLLREGTAVDGEDGIADRIKGMPGSEAAIRMIRQQDQKATEDAQKAAAKIQWPTAAPQ